MSVVMANDWVLNKNWMITVLIPKWLPSARLRLYGKLTPTIRRLFPGKRCWVAMWYTQVV